MKEQLVTIPPDGRNVSGAGLRDPYLTNLLAREVKDADLCGKLACVSDKDLAARKESLLDAGIRLRNDFMPSRFTRSVPSDLDDAGVGSINVGNREKATVDKTHAEAPFYALEQGLCARLAAKLESVNIEIGRAS